MSAATASKAASWYKEYYDKIAVVIVLVLLLGSALFLLLQVRQASRALSDPSWEGRQADHLVYQPVSMDDFAPILERLNDPAQINDHSNLLLVSDMRVMSVNPDVRTPVPYGAAVCPWTQYPQPDIRGVDTLGDGILDDWYLSFGLDPFDPELADRDLDGDGFTVREEHDAGTSPVDATDHPSYAYKLRLVRSTTRPFALRFEGVQQVTEDTFLFQLNVQDRTVFARLGETVEGYELVNFVERRVTDDGQRLPPVLSVQRPDGRRVSLSPGEDYRIEERDAEIVFLVDDATFTVASGEEFSLMDYSFVVEAIHQHRVQVRDLDTGESVTVERNEPAAGPPTRPTAGGRGEVDAGAGYNPALFDPSMQEGAGR